MHYHSARAKQSISANRPAAVVSTYGSASSTIEPLVCNLWIAAASSGAQSITSMWVRSRCGSSPCGGIVSSMTMRSSSEPSSKRLASAEKTPWVAAAYATRAPCCRHAAAARTSVVPLLTAEVPRVLSRIPDSPHPRQGRPRTPQARVHRWREGRHPPDGRRAASSLHTMRRLSESLDPLDVGRELRTPHGA